MSSTFGRAASLALCARAFDAVLADGGPEGDAVLMRSATALAQALMDHVCADADVAADLVGVLSGRDERVVSSGAPEAGGSGGDGGDPTGSEPLASPRVVAAVSDFANAVEACSGDKLEVLAAAMVSAFQVGLVCVAMGEGCCVGHTLTFSGIYGQPGPSAVVDCDLLRVSPLFHAIHGLAVESWAFDGFGTGGAVGSVPQDSALVAAVRPCLLMWVHVLCLFFALAYVCVCLCVCVCVCVCVCFAA